MLSLEKLKLLMGVVGTDKDAVLQFALDDVSETIRNYCNVDDLPDGLEHTAYRMAIDIARAEGFGQADAPDNITSIREGDTSVSYGKASASGVFASSILKNYTAQLNRYRKMGKPCKC